MNLRQTGINQGTNKQIAWAEALKEKSIQLINQLSESRIQGIEEGIWASVYGMVVMRSIRLSQEAGEELSDEEEDRLEEEVTTYSHQAFQQIQALKKAGNLGEALLGSIDQAKFFIDTRHDKPERQLVMAIGYLAIKDFGMPEIKPSERYDLGLPYHLI